MNKILTFSTLMAIGLTACTAPAPRLDAQMGSAVEMAKAQQTLNPQASQNTRPVEGIDGKSADALVDRYHQSFQTPSSVNIFNIGIGSGTGSTLGPASSTK